ncbi:hypothetical protein C0995_013243 [Termitomyces sp. Mi166|nr:hypothetical protein C0995_013243 [Termitomyces sp. Mi166\
MAALDATPSALNVAESSDNPVPFIRHRPEAETNQIHNVPKATSSTNPRPHKTSTIGLTHDNDDATWGSNFWVTLVDPQVCLKGNINSKYDYNGGLRAKHLFLPAQPPARLPPGEEGEWWELSDESRGGIPYYYQTKTGATVWERPGGFVIPLGIIQNTTLGRRLSQTTRFSVPFEERTGTERSSSHNRRSRQQGSEPDPPYESSIIPLRQTNTSRSASRNINTGVQRSYSTETRVTHAGSNRPVQQLTPIPSSDVSAPPSPSHKSITLTPTVTNGEESLELPAPSGGSNSISRARTKSSPYISHRSQQPQSLTAALERISTSHSDSGHGQSLTQSPTSVSSKMTVNGQFEQSGTLDSDVVTSKGLSTANVPSSSQRPIPAMPTLEGRKVSGPTVGGKGISNPIPNHAATLQMSPVKNRVNGQPIPVQPRIPPLSKHSMSFDSHTHPVLPADLVTDIKQFSESEFARQYFSTHRTGFIFRRKVPVAQMMAWQKAPLSSPLLSLNRSLAKDAVKIFRVIQHLMGDRERERGPGHRSPPEQTLSLQNAGNASSISLPANSLSLLEEERWLLGEGLVHGELRDEIYCQLMKQLTGNPTTESVFKGWQLLCVALVTFPPSKNFETYLSSFLQQHTTQHEGRVDVMAKYCLRRLAYISKKGPRGKPPSLAEIETASDSAFNPSTFGETLDGIIRLQERKYPQQKVPIILPFLADGILALGGLKAEGIFRIPGDADSVSELKLRIDRGYYTTDGVNDPHVLASLMKLWLRELCDPLVPEEMYNECITSSKDACACVQIIERLPTINRRVVLFVISFLQLFLEEKVQGLTKMTPANLALVMAPNLLRCNSDSVSVVFTNAQ